jgi:RNA recognition motif-containing protein
MLDIFTGSTRHALLQSKEKKMNIFAGNLSRDVTEEDLRKAFGAFGEVAFVNIVRNRVNRTSEGFGFLGMPVLLEAEAAISGLHATELKGQKLNVLEARPRPKEVAAQ